MDNDDLRSDHKAEIFVSYKSENGDKALAVAQALEDYADGSLKCFVAKRDIVPGARWRETIREALRRSNMLLLVFTEPSLDWDWCLYEVGLFLKISEDEPRPVVCLHRSEVPRPIRHLQAVKADSKQAVAGFVESLTTDTRWFVNGTHGGLDAPKEALRSETNPRLLDHAAEIITAQFDEPVHTIYPCHRLSLMRPHDHDLLIEGDLISPDAVVDCRGTSDRIHSVFGVSTVGRTWRELIAEVSPLEERPLWVRELGKRLALAAAGKDFTPIFATVRGTKSGIYCPELYSVDLVGGRPIRAVIVFDSLTAPDRVGGRLFNLLRADFRFREEVFDRFLGKLRTQADLYGRELVFDRLRDSLRLIYEEAGAHEVFDTASMELAYGAESEQILALSAEWERLLGELSREITLQHIDTAEALLAEMSELNQSFIRITSATLAADEGSTARGRKARVPGP